MKKQLLILMTLCIATIGYSQTFSDTNYIEYEVTSTVAPYTVKVINYDDTNGGAIVDIPVTIDYNSTTYNVTSIQYLAFQNNGLTSVIIPDSVISIGTGAFSGNALTSATIGNSVMSIGASAFINNQLTSVTIPNSITTIGNYAFQGNGLINLTIGNSVTSIGNWAFQGNTLTNVTIPNSVTSIGDIAFGGNPLTSIISEATTPPTITTGGADTFLNIRSGIDLHIPPGTSAAYIAAQWTGFNSVTQDALNVSDFELANDIKVITTQDAIRITSSNSVRLENYTLYSITGSKVAIGTESEIRTSFLLSGIYILKLDFDKGIVAKKVLVN